VDESVAWLHQALSDRDAAEREFKANADSLVWCHAIAKYQQVVEKAVKAIVAGLIESGLWRGPPIGFVHDVNRHMQALVRLARGKNQHSVQRHLFRLFNANVRSAIRSLGALAPHAPPPGQQLRRNTEYPFHESEGVFTYPAVPGSFSVEEVQRYRMLSYRLVDSAGWIVFTLQRER
jgi:hypothetical protein